jgi:prepilin-type N-terminal cleavage/methylation domain-containing protein
MTKQLRRRMGEDSGVTLVEMLVTMILLGVVGSLVTAAVVQAGRSLTHVDDENKGLQDAKVILDRMGRDVREARGVTCDGALADPTDPTSSDPNCSDHLQLWIDTNSNYIQEPSEVVTWRLQLNGDADGHWDVWRITGTGSTALRQRQASTLIVNNVYHYENDAQPATSQIVKIGLEYDAIVGRGTDTRRAALTVRLRNKGTR